MSSSSEPDQSLTPSPSLSPSMVADEEEEKDEETHSEFNDAESSQTKKRTRAVRSQKARKKKKTITPQEKAIEAGIDFELVCSHPKINYLRWCIQKINSLQLAEQLSKKGTKEILQNRIYDYLGVPQNERGPIPLSASQRQLPRTLENFGS